MRTSQQKKGKKKVASDESFCLVYLVPATSLLRVLGTDINQYQPRLFTNSSTMVVQKPENVLRVCLFQLFNFQSRANSLDSAPKVRNPLLCLLSLRRLQY